MIDINQLTYRYAAANAPALDRITLRVGEGEFVVVAGPSGCGKSTLALAIGGYLHHQFEGESSGSVRIAGLDVREHSLFEIADRVGLVQQNPESQFCTLTVRDEVAFGLENRCLPPDEIAARCVEALDIVDASHLADRALATLSGGEKQKVAVASMLAARPRIIVFDEPTSNLDPTATRRIFDVLDTVRRQLGLTIVVIEHKLDYLRPFAPRLVRMEGGRIVADGESLPAPMPDADRIPASPGAPVARLDGLCAAYGPVRALDGVTTTLAAGQLVALMGDNGSGKSTLLRCLMGLVPPTAGTVVVLEHTLTPGARGSTPGSKGAGRSARTVPSVSSLARDAGFIFQNPDHQLLGDTVWDDATLLAGNLGRLDALSAEVGALLDGAGLADRRDDGPFRLSYGQKRRLNLIAATAHHPRLVLADEVLIGQDQANAARLMDRLRAMADAGACVVLALHDAGVARRYADRLLFLRAGRVLIDDAPGPALDRLAALGYGATQGRADVPTPDAAPLGDLAAPASEVADAADGALARVNPLLKLGWLLVISVAAFALRAPVHVVALLGLLVLAMACGGVDSRRMRFRGVLLWTAAFLLLLQALFYHGGEPLLYLLPGGRGPVTAAGLGRGARVAARFLVIVLSSQAFVLTTDPGALAYALMRAGLPYRFGFALVTALRLVPIFRAEATTVYQAQLARGVRYDALGGPARVIALLRQFMLPLLVSALRKVDALAVSMEGRQFGRHPRRTYLRRAEWRRGDWLGAAALLAFALAVGRLAIMYPG